MPYISLPYTIRSAKPPQPGVINGVDLRADAAPTTGVIYDFANAGRMPANRRGYERARSALGGEVDPAPGTILKVEAWPDCRMKYNILAHHAWAYVDAAVGLTINELDGNGAFERTLADWWLTLWNRREFNCQLVQFRQQNPVRLRDAVPVKAGHRYEILVKCRAGAGASGWRGGRRSWAASSVLARLTMIQYAFV